MVMTIHFYHPNTTIGGISTIPKWAVCYCVTHISGNWYGNHSNPSISIYIHIFMRNSEYHHSPTEKFGQLEMIPPVRIIIPVRSRREVVVLLFSVRMIMLDSFGGNGEWSINNKHWRIMDLELTWFNQQSLVAMKPTFCHRMMLRHLVGYTANNVKWFCWWVLLMLPLKQQCWQGEMMVEDWF